MSDLPAALVEADCDCTDLDGFMLNVERLMASELVALSSHEVIAAALFLWARAWKQRPAASLPDDDRVIAAFARLPVARFRKLRAEILRGWVKCADGRLYHRFLAGEAAKAYARKAAFRKRRETDAERLRKWREAQPETPDETRFKTRSGNADETRFVQEGQGQGQVRSKTQDFIQRETRRAAPAAARGTRLAADWRLPDEWRAWVKAEFPQVDAGLEAATFADYWHAKTGQDATKADWYATWRNWIRTAANRRASNGARQPALSAVERVERANAERERQRAAHGGAG